MIRAIIVMEEEQILSAIKEMLKQTGFISVAGAFTDGAVALEQARELLPQLAFIAIELPGMDGLALAENLRQQFPDLLVVFITAYSEYAVRAFDLNAVDYLLRPVNPRRFQVMIERIANTDLGQGINAKETLEIECFGGLAVRIGGKPVKWGRAKAEELFCYLLVNQGSGVHKETILENLWPGYDPHRALPILHTAASKLRNIFAPLEGNIRLEYAASRYCLTIAESKCDYFFVEDVLSKCAAADVINYGAVEKAAQLLCRGFLKDRGYLWAMEKEEEMRAGLCVILQSHVEKCLAKRNMEGMVQPLKLFLNLVPYDEEGNNLLLEYYARLNNGAGLIEHYRWLVKVLREEYDMEPAISTRKLYQELYEEKYG
ncbi:MAG TPA: response regulator [Bacillota bacterium]|nr:response regulator [Bacillota bacterium]